ncbi:MAG: leucine-rich repeat domain-containing protein, partial [Candidatus Thorarchaeota archaeon]
VINKYLKLKLEGGRTNIYVKGRIFQQCMYLMLNIPIERIEDYDEIESIDEAAEYLDRSLEGRQNIHRRITPEEEFMGHCSNLQVWAENGYDTRILHRNLAFPLLKRLSEVGDPIAKKVFREEIAIRFASKHPTVTQFLTQNGYLKFLSPEEFENILEDKNPLILDELITQIKNNFSLNPTPDFTRLMTYYVNELLRNFGITHISLITSKIISEIPKNHKKTFVENVYNKLKSNRNFPLLKFINRHLEYLKDKKFDYNFIKYKNKIIGLFNNEKVYLSNQNIHNISDIEVTNHGLRNIRELDLSNNLIDNLRGLEKFPNIQILNLNNNGITEIDDLGENKIQSLSLRNNRISQFNGLKSFKNLKFLDLSGNPSLTELPEVLNEIPSLETIKLWNCNITNFSKSTEKFFWANQNYRYFSGFTQRDKDYYETTFERTASSHNKLYKHFVQWMLRMKELMLKHKFSYQDIQRFENETQKNAIWSGRVTKDFVKWLFNKSQTKITFYV